MQRFSSWWYALQDTLWFIPAVMTSVSVLLAVALLQMDHHVLVGHHRHVWWLFEGGAEGARGVLTTISGTMMTVATTAFSITIVALQLGSSQFSPRILRGFTGDRGNQIVLGAFISTFAYSLLVLRSVRSESADADVFVPSISVSVAIVLALLSIASLIYFFHHATRTIQASVVIDRAANDTFRLIDQALDNDDAYASDLRQWSNKVPSLEVRSERSGYVIELDESILLRLAKKHECALTMQIQVGDHLFTGTTLASVYFTGSAEDENGGGQGSRDGHGDIASAVRRAVGIEMERTLEKDIHLGFRQLADIAIKALSPGINDPTTATMCIDRLGEALIRARELRSGYLVRADEQGRPLVTRPSPGFDEFLETSVRQIRHFGAADTTVIEHLLHVLEAVADHAAFNVRMLVAAEARVALEEALRSVDLSEDRVRLQVAGAWAA